MATIDYKLVKVSSNGNIITGQALSDLLTAEGFTVPALPPLGPKPVWPKKLETETWGEFGDRKTIWYNEVFLPYQKALADRQAVVDQFAVELAGKFEMQKYGPTGSDLPNGSPEITWFLVNSGYRPFGAFASKLTGQNAKAKTIEWLCFKSLHT